MSSNQFVCTAVTEKIPALMTEEYLRQRARRVRQGQLGEILDRVPDRQPMPGDEL